MESADVVVLGLGPAGARAAAEAARRGCKVIALDRKRAPGVPVQCAEFVPAMIDADLAGVVRQRIDAMATFVEDDAPDFRPHFPGHMLDRAAFDASLVEKARRAGADVRLATVVKGLTADGAVVTENGTLQAPVVVGADGPRSRAGKAIGSVNEALVETRQVTVALKQPHGATDIFLSAGIPGGYGWLFPKGELANLGAGVGPGHKLRLKPIVARLHESQKARLSTEILAVTGGAIPVGGLLKPFGYLKQTLVLLAGDAAGLANPVTGAGIAAAVQSGRLAGQAAATRAAEEYERELEDLYGGALERALRRRRELLASSFQKHHLRRGWIAYPEYWQ